MKKYLLRNLIFALILAVIIMPGDTRAADVTSQGQASIEWNSIVIIILESYVIN